MKFKKTKVSREVEDRNKVEGKPTLSNAFKKEEIE
jgi:hypothetical protein